MFVCESQLGDMFVVVDTDDGAIESYTASQLQNFLENGIEILGVSQESLSINMRTTVLVNFKSKRVHCGQFFNGYYFDNYDEELYEYFSNPYMYTLIDSSKFNILDNIDILQKVNSSVFDQIVESYKSAKMGFKFLDISDCKVLVKEISTNAEYTLDYSDICAIMVNEDLYVEGLCDISKDFVKVYTAKISLLDAIKDRAVGIANSATYFCNAVSCPSNCIDVLSLTSASLENFMFEHSELCLSRSKFPMVNLFDYYSSDIDNVLDIENIIDITDKIASKQFVSAKGDTFYFEDFELSNSDALKVYKLYRETNPAFYDSVAHYISLTNAKKKLLFGNDYEPYTDNVLGFRVDENKSPMLDKLSSTPHFDCVPTQFGNIISRIAIKPSDEQESPIDFIEDTDGLLVFRLTHRATYYYRIGTGGISIITNGKSDAKHIAGLGFTKYLNKHLDLGYYNTAGYSSSKKEPNITPLMLPNIMPLMIHNIVTHEDGIEINILVAINTNDGLSFKLPTSGRREGWGMTLLVVPLLLTGVSHYSYGDYIVFEMLFQDFAISKSMYNSLIVDIDEYNDLIYMDGCTKAMSSKKLNCELTNKTTKNILAYKNIVQREMFSFHNRVFSLIHQ